jgi:hypothetical protein
MKFQVSHQHEKTGKIIILYILAFMFLDKNGEDNISKLNGSKITGNVMCS